MLGCHAIAFPSTKQIVPQLCVCVVLALDRWNSCFGEQGLTGQHHPLNVCLMCFHGIRGSVPPCGRGISIEWKQLISLIYLHYIHCSAVYRRLCNLCGYVGLVGLALQQQKFQLSSVDTMQTIGGILNCVKVKSVQCI